MKFEYYIPTRLESVVVKRYQRLGIYSPSDIDPEIFANEANVSIVKRPGDTHGKIIAGTPTVFLNSELPINEQRVQLMHELAHFVLHVGIQSQMPYSMQDFQESQADHFVMYGLAPSFMLENYLTNVQVTQRYLSELAETFTVPTYWMHARLELLQERLRTLEYDRKMDSVIREDRARYDYTYRHPLNHTIEYLVKNGNIIGRRRRAEI